MEFGGDITNLALIFTVAIAVGGLAIAVLYPPDRVEQVRKTH